MGQIKVQSGMLEIAILKGEQDRYSSEYQIILLVQYSIVPTVGTVPVRNTRYSLASLSKVESIVLFQQ